MMKTRTDIKQLRSFGLMVGGVFVAIGSWPLLFGEAPRWWPILLGGLLVLLGAVMPKILDLPFRGWMFVGHIMGWVNTRIILGVVFYCLVTPMGLVMRLLGKKSMRSVFEQNLETYRVIKTARPSSHLKHQF